MELDELKQKLNTRISVQQQKSADEIMLLMQAKTQSVIDKLKRSMYIEIGFAILATLVFSGIALFSGDNKLRIYFGVFAVVMAAFIYILGYLLKKTNQLANSEFPVKTNLVTLVKILDEYVKRCFQFTMCLLPVCFLFSFWLGYHPPQQNALSTNTYLVDYINKKPSYYLLMVGYFLIVATLTWYFTKWYLQKMFGKYIGKLKSYINELEDA